jgi:hypothetical protein
VSTRDDPVAERQRQLGKALAEWRKLAGLNQTELARRLTYDRSTVAHAERGAQIPAEAFWQECDTLLAANSVLLGLYQALQRAKQRKTDQAAAKARAERQARLAAGAAALWSTVDDGSRGSRTGLRGVDEPAESGQPHRVGEDAVMALFTGGVDAWLQRRDFLAYVAAVTAGGVVGPTLANLETLVAPLRGAPVDRISPEHVAAVEEVTRVFREVDNRCGGGLSRAAMLAQLQSVLEMHRASFAPALRVRLCAATADLAALAAWATYDVEQHEQARRLWLLALHAAREADSVDRVVEVLSTMAHQSLHLGRPAEALRLVKIAQASTDEVFAPVSPGVCSMLAAMEAWSYAAAGESTACDRALGQANERFADVDVAAEPEWLHYFDAAELAGMAGHCYHVAATRTDRPERESLAGKAVSLLRSAVEGYDDQYVRTRAVNLAGLAGSLFLTGDIEAAVDAGHRAVDLLSGLTSTRGWDRISTLRRLAGPYQAEPSVAELDERITQALPGG